MWQFLKPKQKETQQCRKPLAFSEIVAEMGDFSDLADHDVQFKFWLPEAAKHALEEMSERYDLSASEFLRQFLAVHCYGLYAFHQMKDNMAGLFKVRDYSSNYNVRGYSSDDSPRFMFAEGISPKAKIRIDTYWIPELGKNVAPIKIWIPKRMKADLQTLAEHVELTPSNYVREILISRLLGHGMLPQRITMFKAFPTPAADDWEEGKDIPMREVSEEEFRASTCDIKEVRSEWVDADE